MCEDTYTPIAYFTNAELMLVNLVSQIRPILGGRTRCYLLLICISNLLLDIVKLFLKTSHVHTFNLYCDISDTDKQVYDACIGVASTLLAPAQLRMAKLALSMHLTSPTVRMFDQIATQNGAKQLSCDSFVSIASRKICDDDTLRDVLKSAKQYDPVSIHIWYKNLLVSPLNYMINGLNNNKIY